MRSDDDMKNYWRKYSKFGQHEQVTKNLTLNQNNQKEIITAKTSLRWLDTVFQVQYLSSMSINYVAISKVLEKLPPQLY